MCHIVNCVVQLIPLLIINALSMILKFHFSYSQLGYKGKYHYIAQHIFVAFDYGARG